MMIWIYIILDLYYIGFILYWIYIDIGFIFSMAYFQKFDSNSGSKTFGKSGLWKFRKNGPHAKIHSIG